MEFSVEFYETADGRSHVQEFLDDLRLSDAGDFAAVIAGLAKLRNRQYHREPLCKSIGDGLFELRHVGKLNTRILWFFMKGRRIIALFTAFETRVRRSPRGTLVQHANGRPTGKRDRNEKDEF